MIIIGNYCFSSLRRRRRSRDNKTPFCSCVARCNARKTIIGYAQLKGSQQFPIIANNLFFLFVFPYFSFGGLPQFLMSDSRELMFLSFLTDVSSIPYGCFFSSLRMFLSFLTDNPFLPSRIIFSFLMDISFILNG